MAKKPVITEPLAPINIPHQRQTAMLMDLQDFMYKEEDGKWNPDMDVIGSNLTDLVDRWMAQLGLKPGVKAADVIVAKSIEISRQDEKPEAPVEEAEAEPAEEVPQPSRRKREDPLESDIG